MFACGSERKNVLIVYAHQNPNSFNAKAKRSAQLTFSEMNYSVEVSDLYGMNFKATATIDDISGRNEKAEKVENFCYAEASRVAREEGKLAADIVEEQKKVLAADLIIFQFPMYWCSVPAIMKGWFDRVLTKGFAHTDEKRFSKGIFKDKKAMLSFSTDACARLFSPMGPNGDINVTLWPLQYGILHYCGFQVLAPQIFWALALVSPDNGKILQERWVSRLSRIMFERPLSFAPLDYFQEAAFKLRPDIVDDNLKVAQLQSCRMRARV